MKLRRPGAERGIVCSTDVATPGTVRASEAAVDPRCSVPVVPGVADPGRPKPPGYRPRAPEHGALHQLLHEHLETFLAEVRARSDGDGLPRFVEHELREFLTCGQLARGFARFRCDECRADLLVAFSCK